MRRWQNEPLPSPARVALIANDAIGNFALASCVARSFASEHPGSEITLWSGSRVAEFGCAPPFTRFIEFLRLDGADLRGRVESSPPYDLIINIESSDPAKQLAGHLASHSGALVCGPATDCSGVELPFPNDDRGRLWAHREWVSESLPAEFPFLKTGFIGEILCRLCYLERPISPPLIPSAPWPDDVPDVLIAMSASLSTKIWPLDAWAGALRHLRARGLRVGLLGARRSAQHSFWLGCDIEDAVVAQGLAIDLRGEPTLPQVADALNRARLVLTLDNGIMHLAASVPNRTPTIALFRHGIHRLWLPPWGRVTPVVAAPSAAVDTIAAESVTGAIDAAFDHAAVVR